MKLGHSSHFQENDDDLSEFIHNFEGSFTVLQYIRFQECAPVLGFRFGSFLDQQTGVICD